MSMRAGSTEAHTDIPSINPRAAISATRATADVPVGRPSRTRARSPRGVDADDHRWPRHAGNVSDHSSSALNRQEIQHVLGQATNSPSRMTRWPSRASTSPVSSGRESPTWRPVRVRTRRLSSTYTRARQPSHLASAHQNGWSPLGSPVIASMGCRTGSGTGPSLEHRGRLGKWTWPYRRWEHLSAPSGCKSGHARHAGRPGRRRARGRRG